MDGFDTSFFFAFKAGQDRAVNRYQQIVDGGRDGAASTVTVYELLRHGYQGRLDRTFAEDAAQSIGVALRRAGTDEYSVSRRAARITHGMGLPMADALIAASLEHVGCDTLYTGDSDFEAYEGPMEIAFLS
jgi:predicted nucleic acid-binding protein